METQKCIFKHCSNTGVVPDGYDFFVCAPCFEDLEKEIRRLQFEMDFGVSNN